jgi:hypothetical protein
LVVSAIFFDDIDDVPDPVLTSEEGNAVGIATLDVGFRDLLRESGQTGGQVRKGDACEGAVDKGGPVGITGTSVRGLADRFWIGPGTAALGAGDQKILGGGGDNGGVPLRWDEADGSKRVAGSEFGKVEDGDRIGDGVGGKQSLLIAREREVFGIATTVLLPGQLGRKIRDRLAARGVENRDLIAVGERHKKPGVIAIEEKCGGVRAASERRSRLAKRNEAADMSLEEVEFRNCGSIPERDVPSLAITCDH